MHIFLSLPVATSLATHAHAVVKTPLLRQQRARGTMPEIQGTPTKTLSGLSAHQSASGASGGGQRAAAPWWVGGWRISWLSSDADGHVANQREIGGFGQCHKIIASRHHAPATGVAMHLSPQIPGLRVDMSHGQGRRSDDQARLFLFCVPSGMGTLGERARSCERATAVCLRTYYPPNYFARLCPMPVCLLLVPFLL